MSEAGCGVLRLACGWGRGKTNTKIRVTPGLRFYDQQGQLLPTRTEAENQRAEADAACDANVPRLNTNAELLTPGSASESLAGRKRYRSSTGN